MKLYLYMYIFIRVRSPNGDLAEKFLSLARWYTAISRVEWRGWNIANKPKDRRSQTRVAFLRLRKEKERYEREERIKVVGVAPRSLRWKSDSSRDLVPGTMVVRRRSDPEFISRVGRALSRLLEERNIGERERYTYSVYQQPTWG